MSEEPRSRSDEAYERAMRLYAFLAEHESARSTREIVAGVVGYLDTNAGADSATAFRSATKKLHRDMDLLRSLGLEIELVPRMARDADGDEVDGFRLRGSAYVSHPVELSQRQLGVLGIAASLARSAPEMAVSDTALAAIQKVLSGREELPRFPVSVSFRALADSAAPGVLMRRLNRLAELMEKRHAARFAYRKLSGQQSRREVEVYGIAERVGLWYVVGRDCEDGAVKAFRLSRIVGKVAEATPNAGPRYEVPGDFDIAAHVVSPWQIGDTPHRVTLSFSPRVVHVASAFLGDVEMTPEESGWWRCRIEVRDVSNLVRWMLTFGQLATVVAPASARAEYEHNREDMAVRHG